MLSLKIAKNSVASLQIDNVPIELKFVEKIARQYAVTNEDLEKLYLAGAKAVKELKEKYSDDYYQKKVLWTVRQTIILEDQKKQKCS